MPSYLDKIKNEIDQKEIEKSEKIKKINKKKNKREVEAEFNRKSNFVLPIIFLITIGIIILIKIIS